jgi:hypothetical protein
MTTSVPSERVGQAPPHEDIVLLRNIPDAEDRAKTATVYLDLIAVWGQHVREIRDDAIVAMLRTMRPADVTRALGLGATLVKEAPGRVGARKLQEFGDNQERLGQEGP